MKEKDNILSNEDVGRDLETVRALQRRHQVSQPHALCPTQSIAHQLGY